MFLEAIEIPTIKELSESFNNYPERWAIGLAIFIVVFIIILASHDTGTTDNSDEED